MPALLRPLWAASHRRRSMSGHMVTGSRRGSFSGVMCGPSAPWLLDMRAVEALHIVLIENRR